MCMGRGMMLLGVVCEVSKHRERDVVDVLRCSSS